MYLILTKTEYSDAWEMKSYVDMADAKKELLEAIKKPGEIVFAQSMEFSIDVKLILSTPEKPASPSQLAQAMKERKKEVKAGEASEGGPEKDNSPGDKGNSAVR